MVTLHSRARETRIAGAPPGQRACFYSAFTVVTIALIASRTLPRRARAAEAGTVFGRYGAVPGDGPMPPFGGPATPKRPHTCPKTAHPKAPRRPRRPEEVPRRPSLTWPKRAPRWPRTAPACPEMGPRRPRAARETPGRSHGGPKMATRGRVSCHMHASKTKRLCVFFGGVATGHAGAGQPNIPAGAAPIISICHPQI